MSSSPISVSGSVALLLSFLTLRFLVLAIYRLFFHPLRHYPGPILNRISYVPIAISIIRGNLVHNVRAYTEKYGPVVREGPNNLTFASAEGWRDIYARPGREELSKVSGNPPHGDNAPDIINAPKALHRRYRRLLNPAFSQRAMLEQQPIIMSYVDLLIQRLREASASGQPQNMVAWYNRVTFDVVGDLAFGESFNGLKDVQDHAWTERIPTAVRAIMVLLALRRLGIPVDLLAKYFMPSRMVQVKHQHFGFASDQVTKRLERGSERPDFISFLTKPGDKEEEPLAKNQLDPNASSLVIGGSETSSTELAGTTYLLLKHPEHFRRTVCEVRTTFKTADEIDLSSVSRLEYMLAVLNEGLRMYPPVPQGLGRTMIPGGDMVAGGFVPGGTNLTVYNFAANYLSSNFHESHSFRPERWLPASHKQYDPAFSNDKKDARQPFSTGPRNCIGQNLAVAEMRVILAKILWHFDLELGMDEKENWLDQRCFLLWEKKPLMVKLNVRA